MILFYSTKAMSSLNYTHHVDGELYEFFYDASLLEGEIYDVLYPLHTQAQNNLHKYLPIDQKPDFVLLKNVGISYDKEKKE